MPNFTQLHLVNDEKIINRTIDMFEEALPGENLFVVNTDSDSFKHIDPRPNVISRRKFAVGGYGSKFPRIYLHYLNRQKINLIKKLDTEDSKIFWIIWGADIYNKLMAPRGFRLFTPGSWGDTHRPDPFERLMRRLRARRNVRFIRKFVDCIVTDTTDNDYARLIGYYPQLADKPWKDFFYYPIDVILGPELMKASVNGNGIMIGNSASTTNNHEAVIELLSRFDLGERSVTVPLSYNGNPAYKEAVIAKGAALIGPNFKPLLDFMPLADYNRLQASTSHAFFGNLRQEAVGNILIVLYLGAKVFLFRSNPVYEWMQSKGLKAFAIEELTQEELDTPLDPDTQRRNREILTSLYNRRRLGELIAGLK